MPLVVRVVGWEDFQHYRDRDPPWIKLHRKLLDNYAYGCLPDASKAHLTGIWLLAARHHNQIPNDPVWIGNRISASTPVDLELLTAAGFIEVRERIADTVLSRRKQRASLERETEAETEREAEGEGEAEEAAAAAANAPKSKRTTIASPGLEVGGPSPTSPDDTSQPSEAIKQLIFDLPAHARRDAVAVADGFGSEWAATLLGNLRAARNPAALVAELRAMESGLHGPATPYPVLARALHELTLAGRPVTGLALRRFAEKLREQPATSGTGRDRYAGIAERLDAEHHDA